MNSDDILDSIKTDLAKIEMILETIRIKILVTVEGHLALDSFEDELRLIPSGIHMEDFSD